MDLHAFDPYPLGIPGRDPEVAGVDAGRAQIGDGGGRAGHVGQHEIETT